MPAIVRLEANGSGWASGSTDSRVHLVALFRDPGIVDVRSVSVVLDINTIGGRLVTGQRCWVRQFLRALPDLSVGLTVALDNGVRCPCPKNMGVSEYAKRAAYCHRATQEWHARLMHPDGKPPGIVICDRDLAGSLADLELLRRRNGDLWRLPKTFIDAVGEEVTYLGVDALIGAHPDVLRRRDDYRKIFAERNMSQKIRRLSRMD